jgi:hypothetical protein
MGALSSAAPNSPSLSSARFLISQASASRASGQRSRNTLDECGALLDRQPCRGACNHLVGNPANPWIHREAERGWRRRIAAPLDEYLTGSNINCGSSSIQRRYS